MATPPMAPTTPSAIPPIANSPIDTPPNVIPPNASPQIAIPPVAIPPMAIPPMAEPPIASQPFETIDLPVIGSVPDVMCTSGQPRNVVFDLYSWYLHPILPWYGFDPISASADFTSVAC